MRAGDISARNMLAVQRAVISAVGDSRMFGAFRRYRSTEAMRRIGDVQGICEALGDLGLVIAADDSRRDAAPDLLAVLQAVVARCRPTNEGSAHLPAELFEAAQFAIDKATEQTT